MKVRLSAVPRGLPRAAHLDTALLRARARAALVALRLRDAELSLTLTDDAGVGALNAAYRGREGPTDVLAFSLLEGAHARHRGALLGEVVIGVEQAARQARRARRRLDDEVAHLLVHGLLHLVGYDHVRAGEARRMRAEERRLWRALHS
jgi:probable rRNA maturation factor